MRSASNRLAALALLCTLGLIPSRLLAEGSAEWGTEQLLVAETTLYVDILTAGTESIRWTGTGSVSVYSSSGSLLTTLASGASYTPSARGTYIIELLEDQTSAGWDIDVVGATDTGGRVWAYAWRMNGQNFTEDYAVDAQLYALPPGGSSRYIPVIEVGFQGLAGYNYWLVANSFGADDHARSLSAITPPSVTVDVPLYLNPPSDATYTHMTPSLASVAFYGGSSAVTPTDPCDSYDPSGGHEARVELVSGAEGTAHILCDLDGDGGWDGTSDQDLHLVAAVDRGSNDILWDGLDHLDDPVPDGDYDCVAFVTVGELHFMALDVETIYEGMRFFEMADTGALSSLEMYWNDAEIHQDDEYMPDGLVGLESSGSAGIASGSSSTPTRPNVNARSWGFFDDGGKGDNGLLDTYGWLEASASVAFTFSVVDSATDSDGDGVTDIIEDCDEGTSPLDRDSDDDGLTDAEEIIWDTDPLDPDSDDDGLEDGDEVHDWSSDPLDPDSDDDGLEDGPEVHDWDTDPMDPDSDDDGLLDGAEVDDWGTDPADSDSDDDDLPDGEEVFDWGTDPSEWDSDGDRLGDGEEILDHGTDPLDEDSDHDELHDGDEVLDWESDPLREDTDEDGLLDGEEVGTWGTDPTDRDSDDDGLFDGDEVHDWGTDPAEADTDHDGLSDGEEVREHGTDPTVADTDSDGLSDGEEVLEHGTDPTVADTDSDGLSDGEEILKWDTDPLVPDTDKDGLLDGEEVLDWGTDPHEPDTDADGLSDGEEIHDTHTDPTDADSDNGGVPDGKEVGRATDPNDPSDDYPDIDDPDEEIPQDTGEPPDLDDKLDGRYAGGWANCGCSSQGGEKLAGLWALLGIAGVLLRRRGESR